MEFKKGIFQAWKVVENYCEIVKFFNRRIRYRNHFKSLIKFILLVSWLRFC